MREVSPTVVKTQMNVSLNTIEDIYTTKISQYRVDKGDDEDWFRFNAIIDKADWDKVSEDLSLNEKVTQMVGMKVVGLDTIE